MEEGPCDPPVDVGPCPPVVDVEVDALTVELEPAGVPVAVVAVVVGVDVSVVEEPPWYCGPGSTRRPVVTTVVLPACMLDPSAVDPSAAEPGAIVPPDPVVLPVPCACSGSEPGSSARDEDPGAIEVAGAPWLSPRAVALPIWMTGTDAAESPVRPPRSSTTSATMTMITTRPTPAKGTARRRSKEVNDLTNLPGAHHAGDVSSDWSTTWEVATDAEHSHGRP